MASFINKILGGLDVIFFAGNAIKLYKTHFNNFMTRGYMHFIRPKDRANKVGIFQRNIEQ